MSDITLYSRTPCAYCNLAKRLLNDRGLAFREIDLTSQPDVERELVARTGRRTVPQIFFDDRLIGGYAELAALAGSGELTALLVACSAA
jgi:glutaredoxin 3